jgi:hypothetical protein
MVLRRHLGLLLAAALLGTLSCPAQSKPDADPAPCTVAPQPAPCGTTPADSSKPSSPEKFPFPGETGATSPPKPQAPSLSGVPDAPEKPDSPQGPAAAKQFPFPGEAGNPDLSGSANPDSATPGSANPGSSSSSSSSSDNGVPQYDPNAPAAPSDQAGNGSASATPGRHILHRVNPVGTKLQSADERENEDINVAHYYMQSGDLKGAYLRGQDAVKAVPDDPGAHFLLAELAQKLDKREEAIAEYKTCLTLDPIEKQAKDARKALARMKQ